MFKNILKSPSIRKMATSIASVAGAVVATVASSGVVSAETTPNVARPIEPDSVKSGPVSITLDPTFYFKYSVNGDMGPNGTGYEDYMRPIRVAGEVVYCVEPNVVLNGNETVTRAIPLSQGATLRKPGGTYTVSGNTLIAAAFINWFMFNASDAQINQVVKSANALNPGEGDQMRNIRNGVRSHLNDNNKFVFLMQQYYWWGASSGNVDVDWVSGSSPAMTAYWNEMVWSGSAFSINGATGLNGHSKEAAINWMVRLRNLYVRNMSAATYNNDGYILEVSGGGQRLFSGASFTPKDTPVTPPVNPPAEPDLPMSLSMQKKSTLSADEIAKSNGEYSLKDAQYGLFTSNDVVGSPTGEVVKEGALPKYTLITDDNGYAKLSYIESGTWYLKELKAPKGHQLDKTTHKLIVQKGQPEVHWSGEYRVPVAYTTDKPIEKVTQPTPEVGTTLKDDKGSKEVDAKLITLVDTVSYKNLKPGTEYTVSGRLMDKETGNELSPAVTATTKFTPTSANGTVDIKFTLDASKLGGKKVVAFEKVSEGGNVVASHEDINDEGQTVTIKKPTPPAPPAPTPKIGTTLKDDQGVKEVEAKQVILVDTVKYTNLKVGKEYTVSGRLMDKETGKELSPAVIATTKFTPTATEGTVDIKFTLDASKLGGKKVVAFEKVFQGGEEVAAHEDINDEGQTVTVKKPVPNPTIGTTLKDDQGAKEVEPKQIILVDTVKYTNLIVGKEYEVSGRLMDKETNKELNPAVTATTKFTATQSNGSIDIKFTLDASRLAGKKVVAFEKVSESGKVVAAHEDINDEGQTVVVKTPNPSIGTTLKDDQGAKEVEPKQITLVDTVKYTNLIVGKEYEVSGRLMDKETGKELSPAVTATTKFTATQSNGSIDIKFTLDASRLAGKRIVAFEKVSQGGKVVASHEDINDEDQTVKVKTPNPSIGTTLKDDKGAKEVEPKQVTLIDTVKYTNLIVGKEYEVSGRLMDKETGKELSPAVTATTKFTATQPSGSIDIKFTLDASRLAGKRVVAFEKVSQGGKLVAAHEDINDEDQTVKVKSPNPEIGTTLKDDKGAKEVESKQVILIDTVKYTNLTVGKEYEVSGRLMDKETGKELSPAVTATTKFTATQSNGSIDIKFTLDASRLAGKRVVAFEKVSQGGKLVAAHEDINDEDQTVKVKSPNPEIGTTLKDDKGVKEVEPKQVTLIDTVKYTNLTVGKEYEVSGRLMDKETGKELSPAVTATTKFKATQSNGSIDIKFTLDASKLAGKKVVAFEKVSEGGKLVAAHEDINDEGQTVVVKSPNPSIGTTLKDDQGAKEVEPKQVTLIDTVKYTNLIVGKEYEVTGRLMDKETGKELEPAVTATTKFTAKQANGSMDIKFTLDASKLAGKRIVAFEKVSEGGKLVAAHEDINDEDQTVKVKSPNPSIGTTLTDDKGAKEVEPVQVTLVDKVAYTNLTVGKEYTVTGRLMDKETGKELEPAVTGSAKFTPTESNGTVDVTFTLDASKLAGKKVVAFEKVSEGEKEVAVHEDINDEGQTIVVKTPNPSIGTTLKDEQGAKEVEPKQVTLIDTVKYTNLIVGKEYEVTGRLMDKETGKELEPAVTGSTKFTPTEPSGTVDVKFTFDASKLAGKRVVAFEKVSDGEKEVAVHEDINDEDQTVTIKKLNPEIGTTLINKATGDHKASPDKEVTLVDTVKYKNLEVGKEYEVTGRLMDKATGKEFEPAVKATAKFKPTASEGSVDVMFTFDASALAGRSVVAFEVVTLDGQVVATHEDINDAGQTVEFTTPETPKPSEPKPKETPKTKVTPKTGVKGMNYGLVALIGAVVAALGLTSFAIYRKKSHK